MPPFINLWLHPLARRVAQAPTRSLAELWRMTGWDGGKKRKWTLATVHELAFGCVQRMFSFLSTYCVSQFSFFLLFLWKSNCRFLLPCPALFSHSHVATCKRPQTRWNGYMRTPPMLRLPFQAAAIGDKGKKFAFFLLFGDGWMDGRCCCV
jgi:hypothetical protein